MNISAATQTGFFTSAYAANLTVNGNRGTMLLHLQAAVENGQPGVEFPVPVRVPISRLLTHIAFCDLSLM